MPKTISKANSSNEDLHHAPNGLWECDDNYISPEDNLNCILSHVDLLDDNNNEQIRSIDNNDNDFNPFVNLPDLSVLPRDIDYVEPIEELIRGVNMEEIEAEKKRTINIKAFNKNRSSSRTADNDYKIAKDKLIQRVTEIISKNKKYKDNTFSIDNPKKILFKNPSKPYISSFKNIEQRIKGWKRLTQIISNPVVFKDGINANDIKQGSIGSCWFMSTLSIVGLRPDRIQKCLVKYNQKLGVYGFLFFKNGRWYPIIIDDYFPVSSSGQLLFSHSVDPNETWVALFEKAYAKLHGSFEMIVGGHISNGVVDMTAGCSLQLRVNSLNEEKKDWLWKQISNKKSRGWRCTGCASFRGGSEQKLKTGLVSGHAYGVTNTYNLHGIKLVQLRNPWGRNGEWKGKWGDNDPIWKSNKPVAKDIQHKASNDGVFWMSWNDFLREWDLIYIVKVFSDNWMVSQRFGKTNTHGSYETSFTLTESSPVAITVQPQCKAFAQDIQYRYRYAPISFSIYHKGKLVEHVKVNGIRGASWWSAAAGGYKLATGTYTIKIYHKPNQVAPFYTRVYTRSPITLSGFKKKPK